MKRTLSLITAAMHWMFRHWLIVLMVLTTSSVAIIKRPLLADQCNSFWWKVAPSTTPRGRILQTARLLDARLRLAGLPRPSGVTLTKWLQQQSDRRSVSSVQRDFLSLADLAAYGTENHSNAVSHAIVEECCQRILQDLTLDELQQDGLTVSGIARATGDCS